MLSLRDMIPAALKISQTDNGEVIGLEYLGPGPAGTCRWQEISRRSGDPV
jgi:hypothetical protein